MTLDQFEVVEFRGDDHDLEMRLAIFRNIVKLTLVDHL